MEVVIGFSMLKKKITEEDKSDMSKKSEHVKKGKTCRKIKERRKKTEEKGQNCTLPDQKVKTNFILFVSTLAKAFLLFKHLCTLS